MTKLFGVSFESCVRRITELPEILAFAYWYAITGRKQAKYEVSFKKGYSSGAGLRFVSPPFDIVNECIEHILRTSLPWKGYLRFQVAELQIQIPTTGEVVRKNRKVWIRLLGWRCLNSPILTPIYTNQLVVF